jgi:hypothetical protein
MTGISKSAPSTLCMVFGYEGLEEDFKTINTYSAVERSNYDKTGSPAYKGIESIGIQDTKNSFLIAKLIADINKLSGIFYLHNGSDGHALSFPTDTSTALSPSRDVLIIVALLVASKIL